MPQTEIDPPRMLGQINNSAEPAAAAPDLEGMRQRLATIEKIVAESVTRLDQLQQMLELSFNEARARRLENSTLTEGKSRWSSAGFPIIPRNTPVFFGTVQEINFVDVDDILYRGWYSRENWGVWGSESVQQLRFAMENYRGGYVTIHLTLQCFLPPNIGGRKAEILANGYFLGIYDLQGGLHIVTLRLPPPCIANGDILLHIQPDMALCPAKLGISADTRVLGVGMISLDIG